MEVLNMPAGNFDRVIIIKKPVTGIDNRGGPIKTYEDVCMVWAKFSETRANDKIVNAQRSTYNTAIFKIRFRQDITADMVIEYDNRVWGIVSTTELGRRDALEVLAREGVE